MLIKHDPHYDLSILVLFSHAMQARDSLGPQRTFAPSTRGWEATNLFPALGLDLQRSKNGDRQRKTQPEWWDPLSSRVGALKDPEAGLWERGKSECTNQGFPLSRAQGSQKTLVSQWLQPAWASEATEALLGSGDQALA